MSVVVPLYNAASDAAPLVSCLLNQDYPPERSELIFVDNNSSDDTVSLLHSHLSSCSERRWHIVSEAAVQSSYAARNTGIRVACGELLAFTDSDCRPAANWLSELAVAFDGPRTGVVVGRIDALPGKSCVEGYSARRRMLSQDNTVAHRYRPYGQTANLAVRRAVFERTGLFRPYLTTGGDADLCWRALESGWRLEIADQAVVLHRNRSTISGLIEQSNRYARGEVYLEALHRSGLSNSISLSLFLITFLPIGLPLTIWRSMRSGSPAVFTDVILDFICLRAHHLGRRSAVLPPAAHLIPQLGESELPHEPHSVREENPPCRRPEGSKT